MSVHPKFSGAAPVGSLPDMAPHDVNFIIAFRLWNNGVDGQSMLWNLVASQLGPNRARGTLRNFESLMRLCHSHGRRPLMHHAVTCRCAGSDECCLANFINVAATGAREDALMIAMTILRADMAPCALAMAQQIGLAMKNLKPIVTSENVEDSATGHMSSLPTNRVLH